MDLNYYILPFTHEIKLFDDKSKKKFIDRGYFVCPDIIESESDLITKLSDSDFEEKTHRPWSFKYEFIKYYKIFLDDLKTNIGNNYKIPNKKSNCPNCGCTILNINHTKLIYYVPEIHCGFSHYMIHMMEKHDYKPPEKFIEYILLKVYKSKPDIKFLKLDQDIMSFFINFDNYNMYKNFKFINKTIGTLEYKKEKPFFRKQNYEDLFLNPKYNRIIQEFNKSLSKEYIDSEINGCFDIENINQIGNKFYSVRKIIINGRENDKDYQIENGKKDKTYFFSGDESGDYKINYHIHPDYISNGSESIEERMIKGGILLEYFSLADIEVFFSRLKDINNNMCTSLIFTQEGIYQYSPKPELDPDLISDEKIEAIYEEMSKYTDSKTKLKYKDIFIPKTKDGKYEMGEDYHNTIYRDSRIIFNSLQSGLSDLGVDLYFYPKELKEDGTWEYGNIYIPIMPGYKSKLKQEKLKPRKLNIIKKK